MDGKRLEHTHYCPGCNNEWNCTAPECELPRVAGCSRNTFLPIPTLKQCADFVRHVHLVFSPLFVHYIMAVVLSANRTKIEEDIKQFRKTFFTMDAETQFVFCALWMSERFGVDMEKIFAKDPSARAMLENGAHAHDGEKGEVAN